MAVASLLLHSHTNDHSLLSHEVNLTTTFLYLCAAKDSIAQLVGCCGLLDAGGGLALLVMPLIVHAIEASGSWTTPWRASFFFPGTLHLVAGVAVLLLGQDQPDGNSRILYKQGRLPVTSKVRRRRRLGGGCSY